MDGKGDAVGDTDQVAKQDNGSTADEGRVLQTRDTRKLRRTISHRLREAHVGIL